MKLFKYLLFYFFKNLVRIFFPLFFKSIEKTGKKNLVKNEPLILVSNHPNTLVDVMFVGAIVPRIVYFLANVGLFKPKIAGWFLENSFGIPVIRAQDRKEGAKGNNNEMFEKAFLHLEKNGCIYIAVEGGSDLVRRIRPVKSGAARIALGIASRNNYEKGVKILPCGVNYSNPTQFQSKLLVNVGKPILVSDYQIKNEEDHRYAVKSLTKDIQSSLEELVLHTNIEDEDINILEEKISIIYQNDNDWKFSERFTHGKKVIEQLQNLKGGNTADWESLKMKVNHYFNLLSKNKLSDEIISSKKSSWTAKLSLFLLPLGIIGWLYNFVPAFICVTLEKKLNLYKGYYATILIMSGMFIFPFFYLINFKILGILNFPFYYNLLLVILAVPMGLLGWRQWVWIKTAYFRHKNRKLLNSQPELKAKLVKQRKEIKRKVA